MDVFQEQALQMLLSAHVKEAFDLSQESEKTRDRYGLHRPGQSVLLARRLVEAGCRLLPPQATSTESGILTATMKPGCAIRWFRCWSRVSRLCWRILIRGAFWSPLWSSPPENLAERPTSPTPGSRSLAGLLVSGRGGGGIRGGQIIGASDERGAYVAQRPVSIGDLYATIYKAMGIDWSKTYMTPVGRPIYIANGFDDEMGAPIKELI